MDCSKISEGVNDTHNHSLNLKTFGLSITQNYTIFWSSIRASIFSTELLGFQSSEYEKLTCWITAG
jgi:hypothetical protein